MFTKNHTQITKGIAVILLYIHHLFYNYPDWQDYNVNFYPFSLNNIFTLAHLCKVCVGLFAFLSAYGITVSTNNAISGPGSDADKIIRKQTVRRYINLLIGFWPIFILAQLFILLSGQGLGTYFIDGKATASLAFLIDFLGLATAFNTPTINVTWWYMSFAFILILLMPILQRWYAKDKVILVIIAVFIFRLSIIPLGIISPFFFTVVLGIWCANENVLLKIQRYGADKLPVKILKPCIAFFVIIGLFYTRMKLPALADIWDGLISLTITYLCFDGLSKIPVISSALSFLGKHSMNMFLTHTFIYYYFFENFIYSFNHFLLIFLSLVCITLALSVVIEMLKEISRYNYITQKLANHIIKYIP